MSETFEDALTSVNRAQSVRPIYVWRLCMAYIVPSL